jgi:hypothetical protein
MAEVVGRFTPEGHSGVKDRNFRVEVVGDSRSMGIAVKEEGVRIVLVKRKDQKASTQGGECGDYYVVVCWRVAYEGLPELCTQGRDLGVHPWVPEGSLRGYRYTVVSTGLCSSSFRAWLSVSGVFGLFGSWWWLGIAPGASLLGLGKRAWSEGLSGVHLGLLRLSRLFLLSNGFCGLGALLLRAGRGGSVRIELRELDDVCKEVHVCQA